MSGNLLTPQMLQLATALGGLFDAQREGATNITVGHASLVRVHVASAITGRAWHDERSQRDPGLREPAAKEAQRIR